MRIIRAAWVGVAATTLIAAGCGGGAGTGTEPQSASGQPECSKSAILAAVESGADDPIKEVVDQQCSGDWATAAVVTAGKNGIEYTAVLQWNDGEWQTVDRGEPCEKGEVPDDIYQQACETN